MQAFYSGYIEGYYGRELAWEERQGLIPALKSAGLNTYLYAPKEDHYHRVGWREPYPAAWISKFKKLVHTCNKNRIKFIPAVAPGLSLNYMSANDYGILLNKILSFYKLGTKFTALLMDDIQPVLPGNCRGTYHSLGEAHGVLLGKLIKDIHKKYPGHRLWFCPTVYTDEFVQGKVLNSVYLKDLSRNSPREINILWTGPGIISESITGANTLSVQKLFPGRIVIWDNYYANDYCPRKIFLGKYAGRSSHLKKNLRGLLLNPTGYYNTDLLYMKLLGRCLKGGSANRNWKQVFSSLDLPRGLQPMLGYFDSPFRVKAPGRISGPELKRLIKKLDELIFDWKSPLAREWFAFFQGLKQDLMLRDKSLSGKSKKKLISKFPDALQPFIRAR